jgi:hypothetical protein
MYEIYEHPQPTSELGCWQENTRPFNTIVGHSNLGHAFLVDSVTSEYAVLHPFRAKFKQYGMFTTVQEFEQKILRDPGFAEYVLRPDFSR